MHIESTTVHRGTDHRGSQEGAAGAKAADLCPGSTQGSIHFNYRALTRIVINDCQGTELTSRYNTIRYEIHGPLFKRYRVAVRGHPKPAT